MTSNPVASVRQFFEEFIRIGQAFRRTQADLGPASEEVLQEYQSAKAAAREALMVLARSSRNLLALVEHPGPLLRGEREVHGVQELAALAVDRRFPLEEVPKLLDELAERVSAGEPIVVRVVQTKHGPRVTRLRSIPGGGP